jgi:hypothetical protein
LVGVNVFGTSNEKVCLIVVEPPKVGAGVGVGVGAGPEEYADADPDEYPEEYLRALPMLLVK